MTHKKGIYFYPRREKNTLQKFLPSRILIRPEAGFPTPIREFYDYLGEQTRNDINSEKERNKKTEEFRKKKKKKLERRKMNDD